MQLLRRGLLSGTAPRQKARFGHRRLDFPSLTICVVDAESKYSKEETIAANVLSAVQLNVFSMLRVQDAKPRTVLKPG